MHLIKLYEIDMLNYLLFSTYINNEANIKVKKYMKKMTDIK